MSNLRFGWAEVDITPDKKVSLAGQFAERISQYVEKPLTATALAIVSGEEQVIFVSTDLINIGENLMDLVREKLKDNTLGIDPMKVIISAIHTHTGPAYPRSQRSPKFKVATHKELLLALASDRNYVQKENISQNPDIATEQEILDMLVERLTAVILSAWENLAEGSYANGFGRAVVGLCRRASYSDGSAQMWGNTDTAMFTAVEGGSDSGIELMFVYDKNQQLTGIVVNLACPAQCVQHRLFVSPDFWGEAKMLLREHFGRDIFLLSQCSAAGDQCPVDLVRWVAPESPVNDPNIERGNVLERDADPSMFDLAGMKKTGRRIAREIIDVFENDPKNIQTDAVLKHTVINAPLPLRRVTHQDVKQAEAAIRDYLREKPGDIDYNDVAKLQIYTGTLVRAKVQDEVDTVETELHVLRLGNLAFATNPFELFLDYGNQMRARSHARQTFIVQLACGQGNYLPTEKAEKGGHYSAFVSSGQVGHEGGDLLVRMTLDEIDKMFSE